MYKLSRYNTGFTLAEVLASIGILVVFLTAALTSFTSVRSLSDTSQEQLFASQLARAKFEEIRAHNFTDVWDDYSNSGTPGNTFTATDSNGNQYAGNIRVTDISEKWDEKLANGAAPWGDRYELCAVVFDDGTNGPRMYILGGIKQGGGTYYNDVWASADGVNWQQIKPNNPSADNITDWMGRGRFCVVVFDDKIWILGGYSKDASPRTLSDVWSSPDGANWTRVTGSALWGPRMEHEAVVFDGNILLMAGDQDQNVGGGSLTALCNDVWISSNGQDWAKIKDDTDNLPGDETNGWSIRSRASSVVFDNKVWIIGGYNQSSNYDDVWYSSDGVSWAKTSPVAPNPGIPGIFEHCSAVLSGKMWIVGGRDSISGNVNNEVWYSDDGVSWFQASDADWPGRNDHAILAYAGRLWLLGGAPSNPSGPGWYSANDVWSSYSARRMYQVDVSVSWRQANGRIIGEDNGAGGGTALDGVLNGSEDVNANNALDSPINASGWIANRGYPSQIYLGRE